MADAVDDTHIFKDITFSDLIEITESTLSRLLETNELLKDVPPDANVEEIVSKIAVEHGKSITVRILRDHGKPLDVIIPQKGSTVLALKKAIKHQFEISKRRTKSINVKISWKYIWRVYSLEHQGLIMDNDGALLSEYGVCNRSEIIFVTKKQKKHR